MTLRSAFFPGYLCNVLEDLGISLTQSMLGMRELLSAKDPAEFAEKAKAFPSELSRTVRSIAFWCVWLWRPDACVNCDVIWNKLCSRLVCKGCESSVMWRLSRKNGPWPCRAELLGIAPDYPCFPQSSVWKSIAMAPEWHEVRVSLHNQFSKAPKGN